MVEKRNWKEAKLEQTRPAKQDNFVIIERQSFANFGKNESFHDFLFSSYVTALYRRVIDTAGVCTDPLLPSVRSSFVSKSVLAKPFARHNTREMLSLGNTRFEFLTCTFFTYLFIFFSFEVGRKIQIPTVRLDWARKREKGRKK